jgi:biotin carboxylase
MHTGRGRRGVICVRVLLIGGGSGQQPRLRRLADGISTVVICRASVLDWVHKLHENDAVIVLHDTSEVAAWVATARFVHQQWPLDAIAALAEIDQDKAAAIAADLGLTYHDQQTVLAVNDKTAMRKRLHDVGVDTLPYRRVDTLGEVRDFYREVGPPLLLKPSRGRASAGIAVAWDDTELAMAFETARGASAPRLAPSPVVAERYVEGPEFSLEAISHGGIHYVFAVTEKFKDEASKVETGHVVPARIPDDVAQLMVGHVRNCLDALGIRRGITHTEVILGASGPVLVETHLRQAGDSIIQLTESATGVNLTELVLRQILGEDLGALPEVAARVAGPQYKGAGAIRFLAPGLVGQLDGVNGIDDARSVDGVASVEQILADGSLLDGLTSSYSRIASVRAEAADADTAVNLADEALQRLSIRVAASS